MKGERDEEGKRNFDPKRCGWGMIVVSLIGMETGG